MKGKTVRDANVGGNREKESEKTRLWASNSKGGGGMKADEDGGILGAKTGL